MRSRLNCDVSKYFGVHIVFLQ
ncbi:unnamed protein product [Spirodela intermedia]|uniref:Uncharacterized protein n=2 Tax=Spirodela intermedia TaxID=51605 RepID=A0A7I8KLN3_SPIIN|nr:unnamed protein product [Spirodela intermedia]CAA6661660.1 unnamed protein product [Spirodela intermedia]CAA7398034.1 unnamed protein product [Spirodela intermedia]